MRFEHTKVWGFEHALRGMRNPKESWPVSDSEWMWVEDPSHTDSTTSPNHSGMMFVVGKKDLDLAQRLIRAGSEHRKFMRQIIVSVDITAPLYWWKEFDTYKVATVANSTSTMHKIHTHPITTDCFETGDYDPSLDMIDPINLGVRVDCFLNDLEQLRQKYLATKDKRYWKELIRWLPEGWLQKRTVTLNYETLMAMCSPGQRRFHKLDEWSQEFISWARTLPHADMLIFIDEVPLDKKEAKEMIVKNLRQSIKVAGTAEVDASLLEMLLKQFTEESEDHAA